MTTTSTLADVGQALRDVGAQLERARQAADPAVQRDAFRQASQHARRLWTALDGLAASPPAQAVPGMSLSYGGAIRQMPV